MENYKTILYSCFDAGVHACMPDICMQPFLENLSPKGRLCVLGAGKAAAQMAAVINVAFPDACYGTVVTRYGHTQAASTGDIKVLEAAHPTPDMQSLKAADAILHQARTLPYEDQALVLLSGGGSALLCKPTFGLSFEEKLAVHKFLLQSGATIHEINCVRKNLSGIKGGKLGAALGENLLATYIISDVVGDDPSVIASGPTVPNISSPTEAMKVLEKYRWPDLSGMQKHLEASKNQTPKIWGDIHIVACANTMLTAAVAEAHRQGWVAEIISAEAVGEASLVAKQHAEVALEVSRAGRRAILLSGGELTVTHDGQGKGGPNQEYLLALAVALGGAKGIYALACDSDGIDGSEDNAGAYISPETLNKAERLGLSAASHLEQHDSYRFLSALGDTIVTGPTGTNVNDFRAILVDP